jgi:hypothetical protein
MGAAIFYDLVLGALKHDTAIIMSKEYSPQTPRMSGFELFAKRTHQYYENDLSSNLYSLCKKGDSLELMVTPIFGVWHEIAIFRQGALVHEETCYKSIFYEWVLCIAFGAFAGIYVAPTDLIIDRQPFLVVGSILVLLATAFLCSQIGAIRLFG